MTRFLTAAAVVLAVFVAWSWDVGRDGVPPWLVELCAEVECP